MLAYNCSPSFNWKRNLDDATIARFQRELGAMGYKFQFITLAGFHALNYSMFRARVTDCARQHERLRRAAAEGVRRRREGLHRGQAPARGRAQGYFDAITSGRGRAAKASTTGAARLDRRRAVFDRRKKAKDYSQHEV
jgi:isocitrate lyase